MKKILLLVCFIGSMLTIGSCSSDDNSDSQPTTKEALEKNLQGQWKRYKIVSLYTDQEISTEEYDTNSLFLLDFQPLSFMTLKWDSSIYNEEHPIDTGLYTILTPGSFSIEPHDSKEKKVEYIIKEIKKNELILFRTPNKLGAVEYFKRVK